MSYFGCSTKANQIAYIIQAILLIVGLGLMIGTADEFVDCMQDLEECGNRRNLTNLGPLYMEAYFREPAILSDPAAACEQWYGGATAAQANATGFANDVPDCAYCSTMASYCLVPYSIMFYSGLALAMLSIVPCFFFCCCSQPPEKTERASK
mmetsp:Transcript_37007/g.104480  ORF Transcript_37007/g.104480 Transcript_37007/m.104480 type:complete len:152 (-) Transcript_37007:378-833(-)